MPSRRELQEVEKAAGVVGDLLTRAVQATVDERSHEPGRRAVAEFIAIDAQAAPDSSSGPAQLMATLTLVRRASLARAALADRPDRVADVLAWIGENLGTRYRARARYTAGVLESESGAAEITGYGPALREDFLPALVWLLAGVVALYGDGDAGWLEGLEAGLPSRAGRLM